MRNYTLLALALASTTLTAAPAMATTDHAGYVGIEAGLWFPRDTDVDFDYYSGEYFADVEIDHKMGFDGDIIGGYDLGQFRLEGELAYKKASNDEISFDGDTENIDGDLTVWSLMGNALWNPSFGERWDAYIGGGLGIAWMKFDDDAGDDFKDSHFAWQIIAGVGYNISDNIELGLKYRYFSTKFKDDPEDFLDVDGKVRSHSLLASLIFSFGSAPPPPPPPATQTCPDGSVILATDACPPPPPPPPPPPEPERG